MNDFDSTAPQGRSNQRKKMDGGSQFKKWVAHRIAYHIDPNMHLNKLKLNEFIRITASKFWRLDYEICDACDVPYLLSNTKHTIVRCMGGSGCMYDGEDVLYCKSILACGQPWCTEAMIHSCAKCNTRICTWTVAFNRCGICDADLCTAHAKQVGCCEGYYCAEHFTSDAICPVCPIANGFYTEIQNRHIADGHEDADASECDKCPRDDYARALWIVRDQYRK